MRKILFVLLSLSACSPEDSQRLVAAGAAMQQAGQPSAYPVSTLQGLNAGMSAYNGMPIPYGYVAPQSTPMNCVTKQTGIWTNTSCY